MWGARRRGRQIGGAQLAALGLLLVLFSGLSLTTLTHNWIGALPNHGHLLIGVRALGLHHHAHRGDPLDRALHALEPAAQIPTHEQRFALAVGATVPDLPSGVVSLRPFSGLQPELNTYTALGLLVLVALMRTAARREPLRTPDDVARRGCLPAPPFPPPRAA